MLSKPGRVEQSRARILDAAREALLDGGGDFELVDVSRRAGVSPGLPNHRFGSKAGLVEAVVERFHDGLREAIDLGDLEDRDWTTRERERLTRLIAYLYQEPLSPLIIDALARNPAAAAAESERWSRIIEASARNLDNAQRRGQIGAGTDPALLAALICGGIRHAIGRAMAERPRRAQAELTADIWDFIAHALKLEAKPKAPAAPPEAQRRKRAGQTSGRRKRHET